MHIFPFYEIVVYLQLMQKANKISSFLFLGLFSLMMLHQAFPPLHHQSEETHSHITHSDHNHQHGDTSKEKEESTNGFLSLFMDMHVHSISSSHVVVFANKTIERQTKIDKYFSDSQFSAQNIGSFDKGEIDNPPVYHPPYIYFNPYLFCLDLRGPPALA